MVDPKPPAEDKQPPSQRKKPRTQLSDIRIEPSDQFDIFKFTISRRRLLLETAKAYYRSVDDGPDLPLVVKSNWLPDNLMELSKIESLVPPLLREQRDVAAFQLPNFGPMTCVDWVRKANYELFPDQEIKLFDGYCYRLWNVETNSNTPVFTFCASSYFPFYNTCEALVFELANWRAHNPQQRIIPSPRDLPMRGAPQEIFDLTKRNAAFGLSAILIIFDKNDRSFFWLQDRTGTGTAEGQNCLQVTPSGTFQPDSYKNANSRDFSFRRAILRELSEESLGKKEVEEFATHGEDFLTDSNFRPFLDAEKQDRMKMFYLGFGFDPLNTKPEMMLCITIDARKTDPIDYKKLIAGNWEGTPFAVPWSERALSEFAFDRKDELHPASSMCLTLALKHFKIINRIMLE